MTDTDVLVAGAGPVGLATAYFLARHGVRALVVEARDETGVSARAATTVRTIEILRSYGLSAALAREGWESPVAYEATYAEHVLSPVLARTSLPDAMRERAGTLSPAARLTATSDVLERLLLAEVRGLGGTVRFGTRVQDVTGDDDGARVTLVREATGREETVGARYVVGADGAHGRVAGAIGVTKPDLTTVGTVATVVFRADLRPWSDGATGFVFVRNERVYAAIGAATGSDLCIGHLMDWRGRTEPPPALGDDEAVALLHAAIGEPRPLEVLTSRCWTAQLGLASAFRAGPVFLAGDAAHVQTSAGGLGMNTGIADAHNLAWKLAAVLDGYAGPALLDTYEAERRPAAALSVDYSRALSADVGVAPAGRAPGPPDVLTEPRDEERLRAMMFYRYESSAIADGGGARPELDVLVDEVRPGHRLPHGRLAWGPVEVSTVDLPAPEWVLLTDASAGREWSDATAALDVPVRVHPLGDDDPGGAFRALAGLGDGGAVLVRPDGFVAWCTTERVPERLPDVLARLCH